MDRPRKIWWLRRETILGAVGIGLWVLSILLMTAVTGGGLLTFGEYLLYSERPERWFYSSYCGFIAVAVEQPICIFAACSVLLVCGNARMRYAAWVLLSLGLSAFFLNSHARDWFLGNGLVQGWRMLPLLFVTSWGTAKIACSVWRIRFYESSDPFWQFSIGQALFGVALVAVICSGRGLAEIAQEWEWRWDYLLGAVTWRIVPTILITLIGCAAAAIVVPQQQPFVLGKRRLPPSSAGWLRYVALLLLASAAQYPLLIAIHSDWANSYPVSIRLNSFCFSFGGYLYSGILLWTVFVYLWFLGVRRYDAKSPDSA